MSESPQWLESIENGDSASASDDEQVTFKLLTHHTSIARPHPESVSGRAASKLRTAVIRCTALATVGVAACVALVLLLNNDNMGDTWPAPHHMFLQRVGLFSPAASAHSGAVPAAPPSPFLHRNHQRWARVIDKLERGEPLIVGALGASVTVQPNSYPTQFVALLNQHYPIKGAQVTRPESSTPATDDGSTPQPEPAVHKLYNQGAGSMTSDGISLCLSNLFSNTHPTIPFPDLITIEYALNDGAGDHYQFGSTQADAAPMAAFRPEDNIERIARTLLSSHRLRASSGNGTNHNSTANVTDPSLATEPVLLDDELLDGPALMLVYFSNKGGHSAQDRHALVGRHYGIPSVSWRDSYLRDWRLSERMYGENYTTEAMYHPHDDRHPKPETGHLLMAHLMLDKLNTMTASYTLSNKTGLAELELSSPAQAATASPLSGTAAELPAPLNRFVMWTVSASAFCGITYLGEHTGRPLSPAERLAVVSHEGWQVESGSIAQEFRPVDEAHTGQKISFRPPRAFDTIAFVLIIRSWNESWANVSMALSASPELVAANPACASAVPPPSVMAAGHWDSPSTQSTGVVAWQQDEQTLLRANPDQPVSSCMDTLTIVKITSGEFRIIGLYAA